MPIKRWQEARHRWNERPRLLGIIFDVFEHRQKLVWSSETTRSEHERRHGGERFELLRGIGPEVDLGALKTSVAEPERDFTNVPCRLKRMHRAGVTTMSSKT